MKKLQVFSFVVLCALTVESAAPKEDASNARLPNTVKPTAYDLTIELAQDFYNTKTFQGKVVITVDIANSSEITTFQLNAKELNITKVEITQNKTTVEALSEIDDDAELLTITSTQPLSEETEKISIEYTGRLRDDMVGIFLGSYTNQFQLVKYFVATQFEEIHARKAFPCFDEPQFKAKFTIKIQHPARYYSISNNRMKSYQKQGNVSVTNFATTGEMSTYLVAFVVSEMDCKLGGKFAAAQLQLCSRITAMDDSAAFALEKASQIHDVLASITNQNYTGTDELTLAALPQFGPSAMENWGLIIFKEANLLVSAKSPVSRKETVLKTLAHELAHQWFGNLVTLEWWNEMFLNEGFATYFGYYVADQIEPDMEIGKHFLLEQLQPALYSDSLGTSLPLHFDSDNPDYSTRSNDLSYNKGAIILRMIDEFLTTDIFNEALADYIKNNALSNANSDMLWESFQNAVDSLPENKRPPAKISEIMDNWINKPGYPILNVAAKSDGIVISQEQFLLSKENSDVQWYVPITYTTDLHFQDTSLKAWLVPNKELTIPGDFKLFILNPQQTGFYRVNYDKNLMEKIWDALTENNDAVDDLTKAQLIDDQFNFMRAQKRELADVILSLQFLENDSSYYSWAAALKHYNTILQRLGDKDIRKTFMSYLIDQMGSIYKTVNYDEKPEEHMYTLKQLLIFEWNCRLGNKDCINYFSQKFEDYLLDETKKPDENFKELVFCNGLRNSKNATSDFQFLWNKFEWSTSEDEKVTVLKSLGCINDATLRKHYLELVLNDKKITREYSKYVQASVYSNNPEGVDEFLEFISDYYTQIIDKFDSAYLVSLVNTVASLTNSKAQTDTLTSLSQAEDLDTETKTAIKNAVNVANQNYEETYRIEEIFTDMLHVTPSPEEHVDTGGASRIFASLFLSLITILIVKINF